MLFSFGSSSVSQSLFLNQRKYTSDLIQLSNLTDDKQVDTPLELNVKYSTSEGEFCMILQCIVVSLAALYIYRDQPDIAYAVQIVSHFISAPRQPRLIAIHLELLLWDWFSHLSLLFI